MRRRRGHSCAAVLAAASALAVPATAEAHAIVTPSLVSAGASERFRLGLPNERRDAALTGLAVTLPRGFSLVSAEAPVEWLASTDGLTASFRGSSIAPLAEETFTLLARAPGTRGSFDLELRETYADGLGPSYTVATVVAGTAAASASRDDGARTLAKAALGIALGAAGLALVAFALALRVWLRSPSRRRSEHSG